MFSVTIGGKSVFQERALWQYMRFSYSHVFERDGLFAGCLLIIYIRSVCILVRLFFLTVIYWLSSVFRFPGQI